MSDGHEMNTNSGNFPNEISERETPAEDSELPKEASCMVVGIGASAGGLEALEQIFTLLPDDCNLSFVVVMHLQPEGPSFLADFLKRYTAMGVVSAEDGMTLQPNKVVVIPPGRELLVKDHRLQFAAPLKAGVVKHPIDRFFASLAEEKGKDAIAVLLSGYGLDGAAGVMRIREMGGIVIVQEPESTTYSSMPRSAIATGAVDMVLPVDEIPAKITEIARGECSLPKRACRTTSLDEDLAAIFSTVKTRTSHDFSAYKRSTVMRRIERRMTVNESGGLRKYLALLEQDPHEARALAQEILIGVTGFFRDPEAFDSLRDEIIPTLFAGRNPEDPIRIWHACCATGEEAYSVAGNTWTGKNVMSRFRYSPPISMKGQWPMPGPVCMHPMRSPMWGMTGSNVSSPGPTDIGR